VLEPTNAMSEPTIEPDEPFEEIYARAGDELDAIPWAALAPSPELVAWLDSATAPRPDDGAPALVVACGLGDDAEELAGRGWRTAGFDVSPTAIARCHERFPDSAVEYEVADLFALPARLTGAFGLVVEIRTLQSLPLDVRGPAVAAIARTVAPGGVIYVRCFGREPGQPAGRRPWPVSRGELAGFERAGLSVGSFAQEGPPGGRMFTIVYERPRG
jgi:SAM-dependent methyltransferase